MFENLIDFFDRYVILCCTSRVDIMLCRNLVHHIEIFILVYYVTGVTNSASVSVKGTYESDIPT